MPGITKLVDEATLNKAQQELKRLGNYSKISIKLKAIIAAKEYGIAEVSRVFGITRATLTSWIKKLKDNSPEILLVQHGRGNKPKLNSSQTAMITEWIKTDPGITIIKLKAKIHKEFGVELSIASTHRIMQSLDFSYITPRPQHYKQNITTHEDFKKKVKGKDSE